MTESQKEAIIELILGREIYSRERAEQVADEIEEVMVVQ